MQKLAALSILYLTAARVGEVIGHLKNERMQGIRMMDLKVKENPKTSGILIIVVHTEKTLENKKRLENGKTYELQPRSILIPYEIGNERIDVAIQGMLKFIEEYYDYLEKQKKPKTYPMFQSLSYLNFRDFLKRWIPKEDLFSFHNLRSWRNTSLSVTFGFTEQMLRRWNGWAKNSSMPLIYSQENDKMMMDKLTHPTEI